MRGYYEDMEAGWVKINLGCWRGFVLNMSLRQCNWLRRHRWLVEGLPLPYRDIGRR